MRINVAQWLVAVTAIILIVLINLMQWGNGQTQVLSTRTLPDGRVEGQLARPLVSGSLVLSVLALAVAAIIIYLLRTRRTA